MPKEEPGGSVRGITSDVPNDAVEHAKMVHRWAEAHSDWARQHVEDKPKIRNRCGDCAAFRTWFCLWEYKGMKDPSAYTVQPGDYACSNFFARPRFETEKRFERKVANL